MEKKELMVLIGNNVRHYRIAHKMTQDELASQVGKNPSAITRIEGGQRMMSLLMLLDVAAALDVSCDALLKSPDRSVALENIYSILNNQSEADLVKLYNVIQTILQEYGKGLESK